MDQEQVECFLNTMKEGYHIWILSDREYEGIITKLREEYVILNGLYKIKPLDIMGYGRRNNKKPISKNF